MGTIDAKTVRPAPRHPLRFRRGYPLRYTIAFVFTLLTLLSGTTLIVYNYISNERTTLATTKDLLERISQQVTAQVAELLAPVQSIVNIASKTIHTAGQSFETRLELLEHFVEILRNNPRISSMYVADVDGDFFIVRSVENNPHAGVVFDAPAGTHFIVQGIDRELDELIAEKVMFLDEKLFQVSDQIIENTTYDHRRLPWFKAAIYNHELVTTDYYLLFATQEIGLTIARRLKEGQGIVAADLTLRDLSTQLALQRITPATELLLIDGDGTVVAHSVFEKVAHRFGLSTDDTARMPTLADFELPEYHQLANALSADPPSGPLSLNSGERELLGSISRIPTRTGGDLYLASLIPRDELLRDVTRLKNQSILISLALLVLTIVSVFWLARRISNSLRSLARAAQSIREFRLDSPISVKTRILEVNDLADTMAMMKAAIEQFLKISKALSQEKHVDRLLEMILQEARTVAGAEAGAISLRSQDDRRLELAILHNETTSARYGGTSGNPVPIEPVELRSDADDRGKRPAISHAILTGEDVQVEDLMADDRFDFQDIHTAFDREAFDCRKLLIVPLINQKQETIGALQLVNPQSGSGDAPAFSPEIVSYIKALSSDAAVALDNRRLMQAQKALIDSIIHLVAGAIDAKSPYTGGHCQRVPIIVRMLAEAAESSTEDPFRDFSLSEEAWYELHLASWLHDCGKVTTPEYVVDKATKLETITNRIHEIRMRFEVLWRDAEIDYLKALSAEKGAHGERRRRLEARRAQIREDFAFVARCNVGGEFMSTDRIDRLRRIAGQTWVRYLDDRQGLSREELDRKQRTPRPDLPVRENLLADKPEHLIYRPDGSDPFGDNPHGFDMRVPAHLFNHGELVNLSICKGTLTDEERFLVNNHIIQTIKMLKSLPLPRQLRRVPDWAGNHHEAFCGGGYPRGLAGRDLSIQERIMAVADVFEALTAADRPYKPARRLSDSIRIMSGMCRQGHLCPDVFRLLLTAGVFQRYAEAHLAPEQIDRVDVDAVLASTGAPACAADPN
jgi:HD-GYP domain-containing protein (c-di-GMP phosphodiesterase class II)/HAMP domain-containing protein